MASTIKIEIVRRETIKPSSPTPKNLGNFNLSLLDQTAPAVYTPLLLFYSANDDTDRYELQAAERSQHLKTSLSKTLTQLYPLAGIIKDKTTVECNDEGAEYVEARVNCFLSDILEQPDISALPNLLPVQMESKEAETGRILFVQANFFNCGGMAIGVCISHKIGDGSTLGTIIKSWFTTALTGSDDAVTSLVFNAASIFPPVLDSWIPPMKLDPDKYPVTRRYVFESSKIAQLKAKASSTTVQQPTRVEAVTALIWKCMIHVSRSIKGFPRQSMVGHAVNLRKRTVPPLPEESIGNIVGFFFSSQSTEKEKDSLQGLVCKLRKDLNDFNKTALQTINVEKRTWLEMSGINFAERDDLDFCLYSSWCRFPFYDADFGWGKPTWAICPIIKFKNLVMLLDTIDGEGMEALVTLSKEEMELFECEPELLELSYDNPSVILNKSSGHC